MKHAKRYAPRVEVHGADQIVFRTHREHAESLVRTGQATDILVGKGPIFRIRLNPFFRLQLERWPKIGAARVAQASSQSTNRARGTSGTHWPVNGRGEPVSEQGRIVGVAREVQ